ncbi:MAG: hypothetical protein NT126_07120 [Bacteroidetes bacterium]|nr:hypothetical protein [Bacteroidota bacterium]
MNMQSLDKIQATLKTGHEQLLFNEKPTGISLIDFWRWNVSDILSNATRGILAEFIVATAANINIKIPREEWNSYDLETPDGIKIEVKSGAYVQSWFQRELSKITCNTKATLKWNSQTNETSNVPTRIADVYVFCLLHHDNKQTVDPLNFNHWEFYVLATKQLNDYTRSQYSITLKSLQKLTSAISYDQLNAEIKTKNLLNVI